MHIRPVRNKKDLHAFLDLPYRLYRHDPVWVPPLRDEQRGQFDPVRNPLLEHCTWQLFLLEDEGQIIGRIAAFIDNLAVDFWKERIGLFGYFECGSSPLLGDAPERKPSQAAERSGDAPERRPSQAAERSGDAPERRPTQAAESSGDAPERRSAQVADRSGDASERRPSQAAERSGDATERRSAQVADRRRRASPSSPLETNSEGAHLLLDAARDWLKSQGCTCMRGPWSFVSQEWGLVVDGFDPSPVVMAPYNPRHYEDHLTSFGLEKVKDLLCWYVSAAEGYRVPDRIVKLTDAVQKRYNVRIRQVDRKNYDREVHTIVELSNASIIDNWGYSPVTEAEVQAMARDLKPVIQPKGVLFAEDASGKPIGFAIALPDVNSLLKGLNGHLFPFGFARLLWGIPRLRRYRMFALGVVPEYQGKAVDSLLYRALNESLYTPDIWMEINYVLEDNWPMVNAIKKLGATPSRRYRVYEMKI